MDAPETRERESCLLYSTLLLKGVVPWRLLFCIDSTRRVRGSLSLSLSCCCTLSVIRNEFTTRDDSRARSLSSRAHQVAGRSARFNCGAAKRIKFSRRMNTRESSLCDKFRRTGAKAGGKFLPRISIRLSALSGLRLAGTLVLLTRVFPSLFPSPYCSFCLSPHFALLFKLAADAPWPK